jgi:hypothetical protein
MDNRPTKFEAKHSGTRIGFFVAAAERPAYKVHNGYTVRRDALQKVFLSPYYSLPLATWLERVLSGRPALTTDDVREIARLYNDAAHGARIYRNCNRHCGPAFVRCITRRIRLERRKAREALRQLRASVSTSDCSLPTAFCLLPTAPAGGPA